MTNYLALKNGTDDNFACVKFAFAYLQKTGGSCYINLQLNKVAKVGHFYTP